MKPIVYQDGVRVIAAGNSYRSARYSVGHMDDPVDKYLILTQEEVRELASALTWIISEVDAQHGYDSFKPSSRDRRFIPMREEWESKK